MHNLIRNINYTLIRKITDVFNLPIFQNKISFKFNLILEN